MRDGFVKAAAATTEIRVANPKYNGDAIAEEIKRASELGVRVLVFPELCLTGSTCGDLFRQRTLLKAAETALSLISGVTANLDMLVFAGLPVAHAGGLYNCCAAIFNGEVIAFYPKQTLTRGEDRWFTSGAGVSSQVTLCGNRVQLDPNTILRSTEMPELTLAVEFGDDLDSLAPPSGALAKRGAAIIISPDASPTMVGAEEHRRIMLLSQSRRTAAGYIRASAGWGESTTDLVLLAHNAIAECGELLVEHCAETAFVYSELDVLRLDAERRRRGGFGTPDAGFTEFELGVRDTELTREYARSPFVPEDADECAARCERILDLQAFGLRRRLEHTRSQHPIIGISGGVDSTLALMVAARCMDMMGYPRENIITVTMPCFGTSKRTRSNADKLMELIGATIRVIDITQSVRRHFEDIGHDESVTDVVYENAQARERTQVLMDIANACGGLVVGTGDLSELALGWATYNGDHMSNYGVNAGVSKTMIRAILGHMADISDSAELASVLRDVVDTPVSPELLPMSEGEIAQRTEELVGPYELHDFFIFYALRRDFPPDKLRRVANRTFGGLYSEAVIEHWLLSFYRRFFMQQFKRSALPDGVKIGSLGFSPRGDLVMPSDALSDAWL